MPRSTEVLALVAVGTLLLAAPGPASAWHTLTALGTPTGAQGDPVAGVLAAAALAAWLLVGYVLTVALLTYAARLPAVGTLAARVLRRIAPTALRSAVAVAIGAAVVVGSTSAASAAPTGAALHGSTGAMTAAPGNAGVGSDLGVVADLDWPDASTGSTTAPPPGATPAPRPAPPAIPPAVPAVPEPAPATVTATAGADRVVVRAGDTLWDLAARSLPPDASEAAVATAWPQWWQTNRAVIGDDPDLIRPGQVLTAPA